MADEKVFDINKVPDPWAEKKTLFGIGASKNKGFAMEDVPNPFAEPEEPSGNPIVNLGKGLVKGAAYGLPQQAAQAAQFLGAGETAKKIADWGKAGLGEGTKSVFEQTGEMIPKSIGIPLLTNIAGRALQLAPHPVAKAAGAIIQKAGTYLTPAMFGLSQAQKTRETAQERGVEEGAAPYITGGIEWAGETVANIALERLFGPLANMGKAAKAAITGKGATTALKGSVGQYLKEMALVQMPTEVLTEVGQNYFEALTEKGYNIRPEADPLGEGMSAIAPTALMTALLGPFGRIAQTRFAGKQAEILSQPVDLNDEYADVRKAQRMAVAENLYNIIPEENQGLRDSWMKYATHKINNNLPLDVASPLDSLAMQIDAMMDENENRPVIDEIQSQPAPDAPEALSTEEPPPSVVGEDRRGQSEKAAFIRREVEVNSVRSRMAGQKPNTVRLVQDAIAKWDRVQAGTEPAEQPVVTPAQQEAQPSAQEATGLQGIGSAGKAITDNLYQGLFNALRGEINAFSKVNDPVLQRARPYFEAGLIQSPEDLRRFENEGYPQLPVESAKIGETKPVEEIPELETKLEEVPPEALPVEVPAEENIPEPTPEPGAAKPSPLRTLDEYVKAQLDSMDEADRQEVAANPELLNQLGEIWAKEHADEVAAAQQRGEIVPQEVLDSVRTPKAKNEVDGDKGQGEIVPPRASSQETPETPANKGIPPVPGKRSWYDFKDLKPDELTEEEFDRVMLETGPTPEETAEWNARQAEIAQRQSGKMAAEKEAEGKKEEVIRRAAAGRAHGAPEMHVRQVAAKISEIRQSRGQDFAPTYYMQAYADAVGVPNSYDYLAKIADKLGIKVHITDKPSASDVVVTDGVYDTETKVVTISPAAMSRALDRGPGYGIAHGWEALIHELLHGIVRESPHWESAKKRLREFRDSLTPHMATAPDEITGLINHIDKYEIDEMISEAFTNQTFAQWLDSIPAEGVKNPSKTFWGKLKDIIMKTLETFGLPKSKLTELNEIMDQVLPVKMAEEAAPEPNPAPAPAPAPAPKPGPKAKRTLYGTPEKVDTVMLASLLSAHIDATHGKIDKRMVMSWVAEAFGVTPSELSVLEKINKYDHKAVEEAFEYAIAQRARTVISRAHNKDARERVLNQLIEDYNNQPNLASRTSESTIMQQYSTPAPLAWLMDKYLGLTGSHTNNNFTVYEPTAGNGMLLIGAKTGNVTANELDKGARLANLKNFIEDYGGKVSNYDARNWFPGENTQDRVVANPPFGKAEAKDFDGYKLTKLEHQIIAKALLAMKNYGKAAFIIGGHNIKDTGAMTQTDKIFFNYLYNHYNVTHNIDINGDLYARQGTKFPIRLITIEGRKAVPDKGFAEYTNIEPANTFQEINDILERRVQDEKPGGGPAEDQGKEGAQPRGQGERNPEQDLQGAAGNGPGEPGRGGNTPADEQHGPKPGGGPAAKRGGEHQGNDEVQPGETEAGGRGGIQDDSLGGPAGAEHAGQRSDVPGGAGRGESAGRVDEKEKDDLQRAMDEFAELFMPYESGEEKPEPFNEAKYEQVKPKFVKIVEAAINKHGPDITAAELRDHFKEGIGAGKFRKAYEYIKRLLRNEFEVIKAALKSGLKFQEKYAPKSKGPSGNTLIPKNQAQSLQEALKKVEEAHGDIDQWVMKELGYPDVASLYKAFAAEQIDALALAIENIGNNNAGFILGDQTGVGKGRVVAGMIRYANQKGKIPVFVTEKANLFTDIYRDLMAIDHAVKPFIMNTHTKETPADIVNQANGEVIHLANFEGKSIKNMQDNPEQYLKDNDFKVILSTYSQHNQKNTTAKDDIIAKMAKDNIVILDESHTAAGAAKIDFRKGPSNTNRKFLSFISDAQGVLYSSATYAKSPANMILYFRTVLGDSGMSMKDLLWSIEQGGVPFQEYLSNVIAKMGQYARRELDFSGIKYNRTLTMEKAKEGSPERAKLTEEYEEHKAIADATNEHVLNIADFDNLLKTRYRQQLDNLLTERFGAAMGGLPDRFAPNITMFTSLLHNIEQQLLSAIKVEKTLAEAKRAIDGNKKVVIALENTMESFLNDVADRDKLNIGDPINFSFRSVLERALHNCLKFTAKDAGGNPVTIRLTLQDLQEEIPEAAEEFSKVMEKLQQYNQNLQASPIDFLRSELQKYSKKPVYELTGRKRMIDYDGEGGKKRLAERKDPDKNGVIQAFNSGECDVVILNKSGSTGLSLHSSPDFKDQRQRMMIIHQADRDINTFMQTLGRTNRKGQVNLPEYLDVITSLPAELRPATVRERKLASLKANTTSSQEGAERSKETPDMMNVYGDRVTREYLATNPMLAMSIGLINHPNEAIPKDDHSTYGSVSGKIAVLPVEAQKEFFDDVESMYDALIDEVNARGENELISKDYDFQAKTIDRQLLYRGIGEDSPLTGGVSVEKMQVRMLNKPHNIAKITQLLAETLEIQTKGKTPDEIRDEITSKREEFARKMRFDIKKAAEDFFAEWQKKLPEKYDDPAVIKREAERKAKSLTEEWDRAATAINQFKLGATYTIPVERDSNETYTGVLTNILWGKGSGNPIQPSKIKFVFSVSDPKQTAVYHVGQPWFRSGSRRTLDFIPTDWNDDLPEGKYEPAPRYIVTGNILKAYTLIPAAVSTEMVSFTRDNGQREFGLLVAQKDGSIIWGHRPDNTMREVRWNDALAYITQNVDAGEKFVSTTNDLVTIKSRTVQWNSKTGAYDQEYMVNVPSSTKDGAEYYQDRDLMALIRGGNFRKQSSRMLAVVEEENLPEFLRVLQEKHDITFRIPDDTKKNMPFEAYMPFEAWHGSPYAFDRFSSENIGTGEGAQSYGYGLYFSEKKEVGEYYKNASEQAGRLYQVELAPEDDELLRWDMPLSKQSEKVKTALRAVNRDYPHSDPNVSDKYRQGKDFYYDLVYEVGRSSKAASDYLHSLGVRGIKYLDGASRDSGGGTYNYVIFSDKDVSVKNVLYKSLVPASVKDKIDTMADIVLNRPQDIPKEDINKIKSFMKEQGDFSGFDRYFGLPWWNAQKYPLWKKAFDIFGIERPENRGRLMHQFAKIAEPFLKLDANMKTEGFSEEQIKDTKTRIEKTLIAGDAQLGREVRDLRIAINKEQDEIKKAQLKTRLDQIISLNRYSDEELREGIKNEEGEVIKLNDREIQVYTSVRTALDNMFDTYYEHLQAQAFRTYSKQKWHAVLCQAAGADLNQDATAKILASGLRSAGLTYARRIQVDIQGIFNKIDQGILETPDLEKKNAGEIYGAISNKLTKEIIRLRAHLGKILDIQDEKELTNITRQVLAAYVKTKPELKKIKNLRNLYKKQIAFFPRVREQGKHKLKLVEHVYDNEGTWIKDRVIYSEMFDNTAGYKEVRRKIEAKYAKSGKLPKNYEILSPELVTKSPELAFQGVNDINMQRILDDAIENMKIKGDSAEALRNAGYRAIAGQFQSRGWGSHLKHRQKNVIKGYQEEDLQRVLFNYLSGMAGIMTKQTAAADFLEMMKEVKNPTMWEGLSKYGKDQLRNSNNMDKFSQKARSMMFTWYLGGILRPAVVQLTQNFVTGIPEYAKYLRDNKIGGAGKADRDYMKAIKDMAVSNFNDNANLSDTEKRLLAELFTDGVTQDQYMQQLIGGLGDNFDRKYAWVIDKLAKPFSFMEMFNRQAAALTMFRTAHALAQKEDISDEEAYRKAFDQARSFVYSTHYAMDKANLPQLAQGGDFTSVGMRTLYTFRSFTHNFILWQKNNLSAGDWRTTMHSLAYMALFGGLMGLPFFKDLFEWIEKKFGYSPTKTVRNTLRGIGGETLETFGFSGLPAVLGANISGSLAIGIPGMGETPADTVYGVYGGMATKIKRAGEALGRGDLYRFSANIAPEFLRNPIAAAMESNYGKSLGMPGYASTTRGRAIYDENGKPLQMSTGEAIFKTIGFNPTGIAAKKEKNQITKRQEEWGQEAKRDLAESYRIAKANRDPKALKNLMAGVKELNAEIRDRGIKQIVPLVSVSTIIKNSRELMNKKQRKEAAYKKAEL